MATIKFYLDTRREKKDGLFPLKLNVHNKGTFFLSTGYSATQEKWNGTEFTNKEANYKTKDGVSGRSAFMFRNLTPGKYMVNLFGRHLIKEQTGTGVAFVRDETRTPWAKGLENYWTYCDVCYDVAGQMCYV